MGSNSFGKLFTITTFGESHGEGIGCIIDGCPSNIEINEEMINKDMRRRRPGYSFYTSPRKESDEVKILSGVFEGKSTGAPIFIWIKNQNQKSSSYEEVKNLIRVGHANYSYLKKYGIFDYKGGGRASARETACRVAAGAVAKQLLGETRFSTKIIEVGGKTEGFAAALKKAISEGDSLGGVIECRIKNVPAGLGEPIYEKIESKLASAMMSINATRGVEFGEGFNAAKMKGSEHNDEMEDSAFLSNHHGGILGGITTGEEIVFRVAFKPTSSINLPQKTIDLDGKNVIYTPKENKRHDPCVALRAPVIVEAMAAIVLADLLALNRCNKNQKSLCYN